MANSNGGLGRHVFQKAASYFKRCVPPSGVTSNHVQAKSAAAGICKVSPKAL